jgi:hypothetical protein
MQTIQVRSSRNARWQKHAGWEVFEGDGVSPVYCGYAPTEIRVLDNHWNVVETIAPENTRGLV